MQRGSPVSGGLMVTWMRDQEMACRFLPHLMSQDWPFLSYPIESAENPRRMI
jgi:hypothetical protein